MQIDCHEACEFLLFALSSSSTGYLGVVTIALSVQFTIDGE